LLAYALSTAIKTSKIEREKEEQNG